MKHVQVLYLNTSGGKETISQQGSRTDFTFSWNQITIFLIEYRT